VEAGRTNFGILKLSLTKFDMQEIHPSVSMLAVVWHKVTN